jgi:hypothetical protein
MPSPEIEQLQDQQALLTLALRGMLEGHWCGEPPSTQGFVLALDPSLQFDCTPPVLISDAPVGPPDYLAGYDPSTYQAPQIYNWTCAACSLDWLIVALQKRGSDRERTVNEIGYRGNINETDGLMDGSGSQLRRVLGEYGTNSNQGWLDYDTAWSIYSQTPGMMSGGAWYHWVGVRGTQDGSLWIANSAPGYMGVWDTVSRQDFNRLGPFSCVWCVP